MPATAAQASADGFCESAGILVSAGRTGYTRCAGAVPLKIIVILFIVLILASLGSALYFMVKDKGASTRTAKALTWRVAFSITLFALLMLAYHFGFITTKL